MAGALVRFMLEGAHEQFLKNGIQNGATIINAQINDCHRLS